jgi:hypothetical protein
VTYPYPIPTDQPEPDTRAQQWRILVTTTEPWRFAGYMVVEQPRSTLTESLDHIKQCRVGVGYTCDLCEAAKLVAAATRLRYVTTFTTETREEILERVGDKAGVIPGSVRVDPLNDTPRRRHDDHAPPHKGCGGAALGQWSSGA